MVKSCYSCPRSAAGAHKPCLVQHTTYTDHPLSESASCSFARHHHSLHPQYFQHVPEGFRKRNRLTTLRPDPERFPHGSATHGAGRAAPGSCSRVTSKAVSGGVINCQLAHWSHCSCLLWSASRMARASSPSSQLLHSRLQRAQQRAGGSSATPGWRPPFPARCPYGALHRPAGRSPGLLMALLMHSHRHIFSPEINLSQKGWLW